MGLINWLKDKIILRMEHDIAMLNTNMQGLELQLDQMRGQIASIRSLSRRKAKYEDEEEEKEEKMEKLPQEVRDFMASTIEMQQAQKYKNLGKQQ